MSFDFYLSHLAQMSHGKNSAVLENDRNVKFQQAFDKNVKFVKIDNG